MTTNKKLIFGILIGVLVILAVGLFTFISNKPTTPDAQIPEYYLIPEGSELSFETLNFGPGYSNEHYEKKNYVITTSDDLSDLWKKLYFNHKTTPSLPKINFDNEMVIGVFMGASGGTDRIGINKIIETEKDLQVFVIEEKPASHCDVIQVVTYPFHIVKVKKVDKGVVFKTSTKIRDCK